jgi:hypothetical protein
MYVTLNIYISVLQPLITDATRTHYTKKAEHPQELAKYLLQVEEDLRSEEMRAAAYTQQQVVS